jgi:hypothetical protein
MPMRCRLHEGGATGIISTAAATFYSASRLATACLTQRDDEEARRLLVLPLMYLALL